MDPILFDATASTKDLTWFVAASLGILAIGAILIILLLKFLKKLGK